MGNQSKKRLIRRNLLGLKEFKLYLARLGDPLRNFKLRVTKIGFTCGRIILAAHRGRNGEGQD